MIEIMPFGKIGSQNVPLLLLSDSNAAVELIPFGAAVRSIRVPDREGRMTDVCLGYDTLEEYRSRDACIGGARFTLNGREYPLTANEGANQLHGGRVGFHQKLWDYTCGENSVTFSLRSPHGEEGFPGNLHAEVTYQLENSTLSIRYRARSDADTVVNLTNHAYFNLAGQTGGPVDDHVLTLRAAAYTPCGPDNVPMGQIAPVEGTPLDLRAGAALGEGMASPLLAATRGYDHNFVLDGGPAPAARLYCPRTGIGLEMTTTMEGMQLYTSGFLSRRAGKNGASYGPGHGVCLETQHFPDAVNQPAFPSPVLRAGEEHLHTTSYHFFTE